MTYANGIKMATHNMYFNLLKMKRTNNLAGL